MGIVKLRFTKTRVEECGGVRLRATGMIVKQNGWVWVIWKGIGKIERKKIIQISGDEMEIKKKVSSHRTFLSFD